MAATVAGDNGADARHRHQPPASRILLSKHLDLERDSVDALIQAPPVADEVRDNVQHARSEDVGASGDNIRKRQSEPVQPLSDGDPAVEEKGADLVDNGSARADET